MDSTDRTDGEEFFDREIEAFLTRESARRARWRLADTDVVATIRRRRRQRWPTQALGGAAVLFMGLGVLASALILRPSGGVGSIPSSSSSEPPLRLPAVAAGEPCPVSEPTTPGDGHAPLLGDGPVRLAVAGSAGTIFFETTAGGPWKAIDVLWTAPSGFTGHVLLRGARLDGPGELGFGDPADPARERLIVAEGGPTNEIDGRSILATTMVRVKVAGCYGLQIDTDGLSSIVVFNAQPIEDAFSQLDRPLLLPAARSTGCPVTSTTGIVPFIRIAIGNGPLFVAGGSSVSIANAARSGGYWLIKAIWIAGPGEPGPILVRGGRIDALGDLRFGDGSEPTGELRLPIHSYEHTGGQPPGWRIFNGYLRSASTGCYAMQLDSFTGTQRLAFEVTH